MGRKGAYGGEITLCEVANTCDVEIVVVLFEFNYKNFLLIAKVILRHFEKARVFMTLF